MTSKEWSREEQFITCVFVVGLPERKIIKAKDFGFGSSLTDREAAKIWFVDNQIPGTFSTGIYGNTAGTGWWVEYKAWLYEHGHKRGDDYVTD